MNTEFSLMPEQASSIAAEVDMLYGFLVLISTFFSVLIAILIIFFAIKYRRGSRANRVAGKGHFLAMEIAWIVVPLAISMVLFYWGAKLYFIQVRPPAGAMEISCVGKQWMWKFQHPEGNTEINDLHVPLGQAVKLNMISEDVIHSMYVPAFRIKHDVLPGRYTSVWFKATKLGEYHLFCAEYCGAKHSEMKGRVIVMEPAQYQAWLAGESGAETAQQSGHKLFEQLRCGTCHQGGSVGSRGPALEGLFGSKVTLQGGGTVVADEAYLRESIIRPAAKVVAGYQPIMPSFEGQIGEEGLLQLIAEIKSLTRPSPAAAEPPATEPKNDTPAPPRPQP